MKSYPTYDALAVDLDLHFFDKISILRQVGNKLNAGKWFVVTDDGHCHLFDKDGNLDDINKITDLQEDLIRKDIKKIIIPDSVASIEKYAFSDCSSLTSVVIPDSITSIEYGVFDNCSELVDVVIPDSVKSIRDSAFWGCNGLTSVMILDSVMSIGYWAFSNCKGLTKMTIPSSVKNIGMSAFSNCDSLKNLFFKGKTLKQVKAMYGYPWGIKDKDIIKTS